MRLRKDIIFIILSSCLTQLVCEVLHIHLTHDEDCRQMDRTNLHPVERSPARVLDCASRCTQHASCKYIRILSFANGTNWCEIFSFNRSTAHPLLQPLQLFAASLSVLRMTCYTPSNVIFPSNAENQLHQTTAMDHFCDSFNNNLFPHSSVNKSSLQRNGNIISQNRVIFIDSNVPKTQQKSHMGKFENRNLEAKAVSIDLSGVYHALVFNTYTLLNKTFKGSMVYAMEKTIDGFKPNAARIAYTFSYTGVMYSSFVDLKGQSWMTNTDLPEMRIYFPAESEYTLVADRGMTKISTLISYIRQGFKVYDYKYTVILDNESTVMFYRMNEKIKFVGRKPLSPLSYKQEFRSYIGPESGMVNVLGSAQNISSFSTKESGVSVALSPLWRFAVDAIVEMNQKIAVLKCQMCKGHRFRVSYRDSFFDVDDIITHGSDVYFLLPQQYKDSPKIPSDDMVGLRAVLSSAGDYAWCSHQFEGQDVLDSGVDTKHTVQFFVDKKEWIPLLSVYSDGTVATGRVSDIADAALGGKDVNVLIEWLAEDRARLLSVSVVSVKGFGTPDAVVSAESFVTWNLKENANGKMELNTRCDLEKVLITSQGDVQVLIYNVHRREPVTNLTDVRSTWFVF